MPLRADMANTAPAAEEDWKSRYVSAVNEFGLKERESEQRLRDLGRRTLTLLEQLQGNGESFRRSVATVATKLEQDPGAAVQQLSSLLADAMRLIDSEEQNPPTNVPLETLNELIKLLPADSTPAEVHHRLSDIVAEHRELGDANAVEFLWQIGQCNRMAANAIIVGPTQHPK